MQTPEIHIQPNNIVLLCAICWVSVVSKPGWQAAAPDEDRDQRGAVSQKWAPVVNQLPI